MSNEYSPYYEGGWQSGESGGTPITPEALNHWDTSMEELYAGKLGFNRLLTSADDCNSLEDGVYWYSTSSVPANAPFANASVILAFGCGTRQIQMGFRYGEAGFGKFRAMQDSSWKAWADFATSADLEKKANAGYGYGEVAVVVQEARMESDDELTTVLQSIYSEMNDRETKLIYWNGYPSATTHGWFGILSRSSTNNGYIVAWSANLAGSKIVKVKFSGTWQPLEWENPPMVSGVEYRTIERHLGKVIYAVKLDFGTLPNSSSKSINLPYKTPNITFLDGLVTDGTLSEKFPFLSYTDGVPYAVLQVRSAYAISVKTFADMSGYTASVTAKYTKD